MGNLLVYPAIGLTINAGIRAKMGRLARRRGYTITDLVEELVKRAQWRGRRQGLPSRALKVYYDAQMVMV